MVRHLVPVCRQIDQTIEALRRLRFPLDPIVSAQRSQQTSVVASAIKRHGPIMEMALRASLSASPHYRVWREERFIVTRAADDASAQSVEACLASVLPYPTWVEGGRHIQIDVLAHDARRGFLGAYEFKRGHGYHDSGKLRQMKRDVLATNVLLKGYGEQRQLEVRDSTAKIIFFYGTRSMAAPLSLTGADLDEHFGWPVYADIDAANHYFKGRLDALLDRTECEIETAQLSLALGRERV